MCKKLKRCLERVAGTRSYRVDLKGSVRLFGLDFGGRGILKDIKQMGIVVGLSC